MLVAEFQLDPEAVALADTLGKRPEMAVRAERVAAHSTAWTMPCIWVTADDFEAVDEALAADPTVDAIVDGTSFVDEKYYQVAWSDDVVERIDAYVDQEASILNAEATAAGWTFRIRFVSREQFDRFRDTLHDRGHRFELIAIVEPQGARRSPVDLTPAQREALVAAKRRGYYRVPRGISARKLATELDMSHQNLSTLLRRATEKLIEKELDTSADDAEG